MAAPISPISCEDFLEFQETLKKMRRVDDNIIHALNTTIPTDSFVHKSNVSHQCKDLYDQLNKSYSARENVIKQCIGVVSKKVKTLKEVNDVNNDDIVNLKMLRKEQKKLRLMQNELSVEEVVQDRSKKVFYERCRLAYKPPYLGI